MPAGDLESLLIVDGVVRPPVHVARRLRATS
jgi:hypothetical protein